MVEPTWNESPETRVAELVRRLRSGEYDQGQGYLQKNDGTFCCLGVACDMAVEVGVTRIEYRDYPVYLDDNGTAHSCGLPPQVRDWLGFKDGMGETVIGNHEDQYDEYDHCTLAGLNDTGLTFDQIADVIEAGLVKTND